MIGQGNPAFEKCCKNIKNTTVNNKICNPFTSKVGLAKKRKVLDKFATILVFQQSFLTKRKWLSYYCVRKENSAT